MAPRKRSVPLFATRAMKPETFNSKVLYNLFVTKQTVLFVPRKIIYDANV